ncbi:PREDICTED: uncharacterized protein LOC106818917 [Priapulus caudatus]|uniref:Uncharacterized protein LOC106818917 n=1 Tax=Priapulus caudatus TaxID=37621 RepID=A0ABM1F3Q1_PRICU|nr:PREDICTED: uncharacterized protein LOC106818917 [Priapulus caudatus]
MARFNGYSSATIRSVFRRKAYEMELAASPGELDENVLTRRASSRVERDLTQICIIILVRGTKAINNTRTMKDGSRVIELARLYNIEAGKTDDTGSETLTFGRIAAAHPDIMGMTLLNLLRTSPDAYQYLERTMHLPLTLQFPSAISIIPLEWRDYRVEHLVWSVKFSQTIAGVATAKKLKETRDMATKFWRLAAKATDFTEEAKHEIMQKLNVAAPSVRYAFDLVEDESC